MLSAVYLLSTFLLALYAILSSRRLSSRHDSTSQKPHGGSRDHGTVCGRSEKPYRLKMALRKVDRPWLLIDENYLKEHSIRRSLFEKKRERILGCKPVALSACKELLGTVVDELTGTYPDKFRLVQPTTDASKVEIIETGEIFDLGSRATDAKQLQTAATLASEDFNIIIRDVDTGKHRL